MRDHQPERVLTGAPGTVLSCEVFGCGRESSGSYAIAPGTRIRLCHECAEREEIVFDGRTKTIKEKGQGIIQPKERTTKK